MSRPMLAAMAAIAASSGPQGPAPRQPRRAAASDPPREARLASVVDPLIEANKEREYQRKFQDMDNPTDMTRSRDRQALALDRARLAALAAKEQP